MQSLHDITLLERLRVLHDKLVVLEGAAIRVLGSLWSMEAAAEVEPVADVLNSIDVQRHWTGINLHTGSQSTRSMVATSTLVRIALECNPLAAAEIAFEIESILVDTSDIADLLDAIFDNQVRLWSVQST